MSRIARVIVPGYYHHVVQRGNNKQNIFFDDRDRFMYLKILREYSAEENCGIKCYCLMNNHVHLLVVPLEENSLSRSMQKISLSYTQYFNKRYLRTGRLWECRFFSSIIQDEGYLWNVCRYIERNPVRAGMVLDPISFKWSSVIAFSLGNTWFEPIWRKAGEKEGYFEYLTTSENPEETKKITCAFKKGVPMGGEDFINSISNITGIQLRKSPRGRPRKGDVSLIT